MPLSISTGLRSVMTAVTLGWPLAAAPASATDDFERVNRLRAEAGLPVLRDSPELARAARSHAAYLDRHREPGRRVAGLSAHEQRPDSEGFSGATPAERALAAGYPHRAVLENVSMGHADAQSAIAGLMGAIYHRLTFLDLASDQLGVAVGERSRVFLLGRRDITALCGATPPEAIAQAPVDCLGTPMTRVHYETLCATLPAKALFRAPHPTVCPNGTRLAADYMAALCARPPRAARFAGQGRYYAPCGDATRLDGDWFDALCRAPPAAARYPASGAYAELCEPPRRVFAEWLQAYCADLPAEAVYSDSGRFQRPCAAPTAIRSEYLAQLDDARRQRLPEVVRWPPPGADDVPPAFFVEEPDPLPDLAVSGYPVSIQFNPTHAAAVELLAFELHRLRDGRSERIAATRLLDANSDPNGLLSGHEFALFPLQRLDWGGTYQVRVEALVDGRSRRYEWGFDTLGGDLPLLIARRSGQRFAVTPGRDHLLYLPPRDGRPFTISETRVEYRRGNVVTLTPIDRNSLRLGLQARDCSPVRLVFEDGFTVELVAAGCAG